MLGFIWNLLFFIIALGILVAVHEWGHFIVARLCKVKVHRFSVGFGKVLFTRTDKYGTEFVISAIPLGGYVKMLDSRNETVAPHQREQAFDLKPVKQRIAIIAAGPAVNFIFAVMALMLMYMVGVDKVKPVIGEVTENSIFATADIPVKSEIIAVGKHTTRDWNKVTLEMISHIGQDSMEITFRRENQKTSQKRIVDIRQWNFDPDTESVLSSLGLDVFRPDISTKLSLVEKYSAADKQGIKIGDIIKTIDGVAITRWSSFVDYVQVRPEQEVVIKLQRNGQNIEKTVTVGKVKRNGQYVGYLGVLGTVLPWPDDLVFTDKLNVFDSLIQGAKETVRLTSLSFSLIGKLLTGDLSVNTLSGPISIAKGAGSSASIGFVYFLSFLALVSINLGVINLLPLPVLDGGHIMYFAIEWIKGTPVSETIQQVGYKLGAAAVLMIMTIAIFNDLGRI